jgi:hypothetical protein
MNKAFMVVYRILLLGALGTIAGYAYLIHERMPLSYGELRNSSKLRSDVRRQILDRQAVVHIPDTISVEVDNSPLDVEVQNEVQVTGSVSIDR